MPPSSSPQLDTRPPRKPIQGAEWVIHVALVRDGQQIESSDHRLRISDTRLVNEFNDTCRAIGLWVDDQGQARARREERDRKATRRKK